MSRPQPWLRERLRNRPTASQRGLAGLLGLPASRVAEMIAGSRRIAVTEVPDIAAYLGMRVEDVVWEIVMANREPRA